MPQAQDFQIIMSSLARIEAKQDEQNRAIGRINERLAKIEVKQQNQEIINTRVDELYSVKDKGVGAKTVVGWLVSTGIALAAFFR